jgi:hypothetical protein
MQHFRPHKSRNARVAMLQKRNPRKRRARTWGLHHAGLVGLGGVAVAPPVRQSLNHGDGAASGPRREVKLRSGAMAQPGKQKRGKRNPIGSGLACLAPSCPNFIHPHPPFIPHTSPFSSSTRSIRKQKLTQIVLRKYETEQQMIRVGHSSGSMIRRQGNRPGAGKPLGRGMLVQLTSHKSTQRLTPNPEP